MYTDTKQKRVRPHSYRYTHKFKITYRYTQKQKSLAGSPSVPFNVELTSFLKGQSTCI